ncbi:MAG: GatB/YqeY domain-containing protein [Candidatus Zixiibacteriota bacterium]|nr:MAG: GatB/YqeY domain-containing protein [candidate division Zixibacteria bacterium]HHI02161.1 GatB/YqeY domain-containing protein [candidate division Zixibacteria bacterium]
MSLLKRIDEDLIKALKNRENDKVTLFRGLKSDIKYKQIEKGEKLTDDEVSAVLTSAAKRRRDSIEQFKAGGRQDLVDKETAELEIIKVYLPEQLSEEKLREIISRAIEKTGADSPARMGLVMKEVMPEVKGKADGKTVNKIAVEMLSKGGD